MACNEIRNMSIPVLPDWLVRTQEALFQKWSSTTGHRPGAGRNTWACEIYRGCTTCQEHLSLPCSLLSEANEIGAFLTTRCFADDPAIFLRLYLIILSEFIGQLEGAAEVMDLRIGKKPHLVSLWANRWGKHRLQILLQHHPGLAFADQYGSKWAEVEKDIRTGTIVDRCGNNHAARVIDTNWLEQHHGKRLNPDANGPGRTVILVPPMMDFLDPTIRYFRGFVDACLKDPERIRRFESEAFACCW